MEWRIFFIGPMGSKKSGKGSAKTDDYSSHLPKLHEHIVSHLETLGYTGAGLKGPAPTQGSHVSGVSLARDGDNITILTPFNLHGSGDIPEEVFNAIDHSDLIIADLSGNKPAVIYELAFVHALGIETILVGGHNTRSFYLSHTKIINIDFRAETISAPDLDARIASWVNNKNKLFNSINPLQKFYGAPLPDISAARGLAVGFYDNFARPILIGGKMPHKNQNPKDVVSEKPSDLNGLIVLRPENLDSSIEEMRAELEDLLNLRFPGEVQPPPLPKEEKHKEPEKVFITTDEGARTAFFLVRGYLIDIPRTMFSLAHSPRLQRFPDNTSTEKSLKKGMEGVLINRFFENVKHYIKKDTTIKEKRWKFHIGSLEELPSIIETGQSKTWDT